VQALEAIPPFCVRDDTATDGTPAVAGSACRRERPCNCLPRTRAPTQPREFGDTVAFLFTDIESSPRSWESDPDVTSKAPAGHDRALADACERWGGTVFNHTGDGMCAAFPTAAAAIGAAVAAQQAGATPRAALRVRMGVHAGTVERRAGNFCGPTLSRTARLMATAWGDQTALLVLQVGAELGDERIGPRLWP
jgi:class 3 adenylate cyclase